MPELPEVEHVRRMLEPKLRRRVIEGVRLSRPDVLRSGSGRGRSRPLLSGRVRSIERHGKQLAIRSTAGVLCVHLGMTGQLRVVPAGRRLPDTTHVHCTWHLSGGGRLVFRDPRRFGGLWWFPSMDTLIEHRWTALGPDAMHVDAKALARRLAITGRAVKAALLDQTIVAGIGNIYADESLFRARIDPRSVARRIPAPAARRLSTAIRSILRHAIDAGGSSVRDYVDACGQEGEFADQHLVYGRAGEACPECGQTLTRMVLAQRTTVVCTRCQHRYR